MTHKIIKTYSYLLIVDDSEIQVGDCITDKYRVWQWEDDSSLLGRHKIIAHIPLNGSPILEGLDLLPPIEDDVEQLAEISSELQEGTYTIQYKITYKHGFKDGYNKAREKYNLTLSKFIELYVNETGYGMDMWSNEENETMSTIAKIIQSFHQYPTEFETEDVLTPSEIFYPNDVPYSSPKKITTSQGIQWVGKYK